MTRTDRTLQEEVEQLRKAWVDLARAIVEALGLMRLLVRLNAWLDAKASRFL